jgi:flagellar biosynthesis protein FlhG
MREAENDQATGLRRLFSRATLQVLSVRGSDDCGATAVTLELAAAMVGLGHRPLIIDLENGRAARGLGLQPRYELAHVLCGDKALVDVLLTGDNGVAVLPAMRTLERAAGHDSWKRTLSGLLREAKQSFNIWLINGGAGPVVETENPLLVIAPTREAITTAYAQIKSLARNHGQRDIRIVVDRAASESAALCAYASIAETSRRFLAARLDYCGYLPPATRTRPAPLAVTHTKVTETRSPRAHAFCRLAVAVVAAIPANRPQPALEMGR